MLVTNARIHTMAEDDQIENGFLFVKDGKIKDIGSMSSCKNFNENEKTIDVHGMSVFPGFIDAFSYVGINGLDFCDEEKKLIAPHLKAIDSVDFNSKSFKNTLDLGFTTVLISPMSNRLISGQIFASKTYAELHDDLILNPSVGIKISLNVNNNFFYNKKPISKMFAISEIRKEFLKTKKYLEDKNFSISNLEHFESPSYNVEHEALAEVVEKSIPAFVSAKSKNEILACIRLSQELSIKTVLVNPLEINLIDEKLLLKNNIDVLFGPFNSTEFFNEELGRIFETLKFLNKSKITTALVSSYPFSSVLSLRSAMSVAVESGILDYKEAIKTITINSAKICALQKRIGSLEIGKDADFVVFENDDALLATKKPEFIVCSGALIKQNTL